MEKGGRGKRRSFRPSTRPRRHGDSGQGDGADGATLSPKPRDFTDCAIMSKIPDATIVKAIKKGRGSGRAEQRYAGMGWGA